MAVLLVAGSDGDGHDAEDRQRRGPRAAGLAWLGPQPSHAQLT